MEAVTRMTSELQKSRSLVSKQKERLAKKDADNQLLKEKAKGIVEAGKNIFALQEERDVLKAQLESANTAHKGAMAEAKNTHAAEIQSLKDLVARQDERLRMQEEDNEASRKSYEDSMVTLRKELDHALAQLDSVDAELRSMDGSCHGSCVEQLQVIKRHLASFTAASAEVMKRLAPQGGTEPGNGDALAQLKRAPERITEWKGSCARAGAHTALALVVAHELEANLWQITKGFPEFDMEGNPADVGAAWKAAATYACKVACLADTNVFMKDLGDPTKPEGEPSSEDEAEADDSEATDSDEVTNDPPVDPSSSTPAV